MKEGMKAGEGQELTSGILEGLKAQEKMLRMTGRKEPAKLVSAWVAQLETAVQIKKGMRRGGAVQSLQAVAASLVWKEADGETGEPSFKPFQVLPLILWLLDHMELEVQA